MRFSDFLGSIVSSFPVPSSQRVPSLWLAILRADKKSIPLGTGIKMKDLGPGACLIEAELVELAWFFSEKETGEDNY